MGAERVSNMERRAAFGLGSPGGAEGAYDGDHGDVHRPEAPGESVSPRDRLPVVVARRCFVDMEWLGTPQEDGRAVAQDRR
jgi:hypothetical protein